MTRLLLLLAALLLPVAPACAEQTSNQFSGAYLLYICEMDDKGAEKVKGGHTACQAYIAGVIDYHRMLQSMGLAPELNICVPTGAAMKDLHRAVLAYLRDRTEHDSFIAAPAVTMALYKAYPCKRK